MTKEPDMTFNEDTEFAVKNVGYGMVSWEPGSNFTEYRDGRMFTDTFDRIGLIWNGTNWRTEPDELGLTCFIVRREDMTPEQIEEAWGDD